MEREDARARLRCMRYMDEDGSGLSQWYAHFKAVKSMPESIRRYGDIHDICRAPKRS